MIENFNQLLLKLLVSEGGLNTDPKDPGNPNGSVTNLGVTQAVWAAYLGHRVSVSDMVALTPEVVFPLYKRKYWDSVNGDNLLSGLDYCLFDTAVNSGPGRAAKILQGVLGVTQDGAIGPNTLTAIGNNDLSILIASFCDARLDFLKSLTAYSIYGNGWSNRVNQVLKDSLTMVKNND